MSDIVSQIILDKIQPGAMFLGGVAAGILYGITCLQVYMFFFKNSRDSWFFKLYIFVLWVLDSLHIAMIIHGIYYYLVQNFGNAFAMLKPTWSLCVQVYFTIASDFLIRIIFGKRVWVLSRSYILTGAIAATTLACAVTGIIYTTKGFQVAGFAELLSISQYLYTSLGSGVASDILVAISLCVGLMKTRTGFKKTDGLVHTLMAYAINTSLLTTLCSIGCFITYAIWPDKLIFMGIYFCLSKLYFNSLMAALNARQSLRAKVSRLSSAPTSITAAVSSGSGQGGNSLYSKRMNFYELDNSTGLSSPMQQKILVNVDHRVHIEGERPDEDRIGMAV